MLKRLLLIPILMGFPMMTQATIQVIAEGIETDSAQSATKALVINSDIITNSNAKDLGELLQLHSGMNITRTGGSSQTSSIQIRGGKSSHTLFLIDGVEVNDPLSTDRLFDLSNIPVHSIERVEILKGAQSVLYGSDAMAGVINIILKKHDAANFATTYGSFDHRKVLLASGFGNNSISIAQEKENGFSAAKVAPNSGADNDGFEKTHLHFKTKASINNHSNIRFFTRIQKATIETDTNGGINGDDPDNHNKSLQLTSQIKYDQFIFDGLGKLEVASAYNLSKRDQINPAATSTSVFDFKGSMIKVPIKYHHFWSEENTSTFGLELERESGSSRSSSIDKSNDTYSAFAHHYHNTKKYFGSVGSRIENYNAHNNLTYKVSAGAKLNEKLTLRLSHTTALKRPSLFQLYSSYGNRELKAEKSSSIDGGIEYQSKNYQTALTAFYSDFEELIDFANNRYINQGAFYTKGVEWDGFIKLPYQSQIAAQYTFLANDELTNRPQHQASVSLSNSLIDKLKTTLSYLYKGNRLSLAPVSFQNINLPSYSLLNIDIHINLNNKIECLLSLNNTLDKKYEDVAGFNTPSRSYQITMKVAL